jgi:hypothetical protein
MSAIGSTKRTFEGCHMSANDSYETAHRRREALLFGQSILRPRERMR